MFTEYSLWWLLPVIAVALGASYFLYFYKLKSDFTSKERWILAVLRFFGLFLILFLLLSPIISYKSVKKEKPLIVIAQDNSQSLLLTKYSSLYKGEYLKGLNSMNEALKQDYNIRFVTFGSKTKEINNKNINLSYNDYATDISSCLNSVRNTYQNSNLAAVVLASDGITNKGVSPLNDIDDYLFPIYTIALGDTTVKKDLLLSDVSYNHTVAAGTDFPLHITAQAKKAQGLKSVCRITKEGKTIFEKAFVISSDNFSQDFLTTLSAQKPGMEHWRINLQVIKGEQTIANNTKDIFVRVLDSKRQILIVANAPHPDIEAMKQSLKSNQNYSVKSIIFGQNSSITTLVENCDALILHNIPSNQIQMQFISSLRKANKPLLYVLGDKVNASYFNSLNSGVQMTNRKGSVLVQSTGVVNKDFTLFSISEDIEELLAQLPPLNVPYASYTLSNGGQSLINQKIGTLSTAAPLLSFSSNVTSARNAVLCGEGFWRWRLQNYMINSTFAQSDAILLKTLQYLCSAENDKNFKVICSDVFSATQNVQMTAELYDKSQSLINTPDVILWIKDAKGKRIQYAFGRGINDYVFDGGVFPQGEYSFEAQTIFDGKKLTDRGSFFVSSESLEGVNLVADHNLLFTISERSGGKMIYPSQLTELQKLLAQNQNIKPLLHQIIQDTRLLECWWYLLAVILCFAAEWFLRKYWSA